MEFPIVCPNADSLVASAVEWSAGLAAGAVVGLVGDLGMGKTHWTKGLLRGLGSEEVVTSPTFSLVQEYGGGRLAVFHFDFYRLKDVSEVLALGWDDYLEAGGLVVVEWADLFPELFPDETVWLRIRAKNEGRLVERLA